MPNDIINSGLFHTFVYGSPQYIAIALLFPLAFTWADRFWGADKRKLHAKLIVVATMVAAWLAFGPVAIIATIIWAVYRSLSFSGGAAAPTNDSERARARKRHMIIIVPMMIVGFLTGWVESVTQGVIAAGIFAVAAYVYSSAAISLALEYGNELVIARANGTPIGKTNMKLERKRGLIFGLLLAVAFWATYVLKFLGI